LSVGDSITLTIDKQDSAISYQWFRGADTLAGATDTFFTITNATAIESEVQS